MDKLSAFPRPYDCVPPKDRQVERHSYKKSPLSRDYSENNPQDLVSDVDVPTPPDLTSGQPEADNANDGDDPTPDLITHGRSPAPELARSPRRQSTQFAA